MIYIYIDEAEARQRYEDGGVIGATIWHEGQMRSELLPECESKEYFDSYLNRTSIYDSVEFFYVAMEIDDDQE